MGNITRQFQKLRPGIDFEIPDDYAHEPYPEYLEAGYFALIEPKLFPDGIVRRKLMVTDSGVEFLRQLFKDNGNIPDN